MPAGSHGNISALQNAIVPLVGVAFGFFLTIVYDRIKEKRKQGRLKNAADRILALEIEANREGLRIYWGQVEANATSMAKSEEYESDALGIALMSAHMPTLSRYAWSAYKNDIGSLYADTEVSRLLEIYNLYDRLEDVYTSFKEELSTAPISCLPLESEYWSALSIKSSAYNKYVPAYREAINKILLHT